MKNNKSITKIIKIILSNSNIEEKLSKFFSECLKEKLKVTLNEINISPIEQNDNIFIYHKDEKNLLILGWDKELAKLLLKDINEMDLEISQINKKVLLYKFGLPTFEIFREVFQNYICLTDLNIDILHKDLTNFENDFCNINYKIKLSNSEFSMKFFIPSKTAFEIFSSITISDIFSKRENGNKYDFYKIPLKASIIFGKKDLTVLEYLKIKTNDTITLSKDSPTTVWICFENGKKIKGILGTSQGKLAVKIIEM